MRGTLKTSTLESKFPLLRVENNCIISKFADITAAYRVSLPELFTLTGEEYEALHGAWLKALKVLPDYTVVHKQDFFIEERYTAPEDGSERSFLARSYERHFNERPYLRHTCYLFVTKTTPEQMRQTSASSVLCRGFIVPREMRDTDAVTRFLEAAEQMERILTRRAAYGSRDRRHGGRRRAAGPLLRPLGRTASGRQRGYPSRPGRDAYRGQIPLDAHALRSGHAAAERGDGFPLRAPLDRPLGLPPLVRGARGTAALLQPCLQSGDLPRRPRRNAQASRSLGPEHELAGGLFALERHQPRVGAIRRCVSNC